jgi:hypothetical protein
MHETLNQHPNIQIPDGEVAFFEDPDFYPHNASLVDRLDQIETGKLFGIHRTTYLGRPECAPRISKLLPHAKLIVLLRNPIDRAISAYHHLVRHGLLRWNDPNIVFNDLLLDRIEPHYGRQILDFGRYGEALARYLDYFSADQILIITDSELRSADRSYRKACRFLGVSETFVPPNLSRRFNTGAYHLPILRSLNKLAPLHYQYDFQYGRVYRKIGVMSDLAHIASNCLGKIERMLPDRRQAIRAMCIGQEMRARLADYYRPDIDLLTRLTSLNLDHWKKAAEPKDRMLISQADLNRPMHAPIQGEAS